MASPSLLPSPGWATYHLARRARKEYHHPHSFPTNGNGTPSTVVPFPERRLCRRRSTQTIYHASAGSRASRALPCFRQRRVGSTWGRCVQRRSYKARSANDRVGPGCSRPLARKEHKLSMTDEQKLHVLPQRTRTPRDDVWDSLTAHFGNPRTKTERAMVGRVVAELLEAGATEAETRKACEYVLANFDSPSVNAVPKWFSRANGVEIVKKTAQQIEIDKLRSRQ